MNIINHRDPKNGSITIVYKEDKGTYRQPHDHGNGTVVYAIISGEVEMGSFTKSTEPSGQIKAVLKNKETLRAGDTRTYHPGDIHDTLALTDAVILRITSIDLKVEEQEGRMHRYEV